MCVDVWGCCISGTGGGVGGCGCDGVGSGGVDGLPGEAVDLGSGGGGDAGSSGRVSCFNVIQWAARASFSERVQLKLWKGVTVEGRRPAEA